MSEAQMRRISYLRSIVKDRDAEIERLRAALRDLRELLEYEGGAFCVCDDPYVMDRARAALEEGRT